MLAFTNLQKLFAVQRCILTLIVTSYQEHIIDTQAPQISTTKLVLYKVRV